MPLPRFSGRFATAAVVAVPIGRAVLAGAALLSAALALCRRSTPPLLPDVPALSIHLNSSFVRFFAPILAKILRHALWRDVDALPRLLPQKPPKTRESPEIALAASPPVIGAAFPARILNGRFGDAIPNTPAPRLKRRVASLAV